ncbi:MAG: discoidin domain-containing protein [Planctomycetes bacterium]|nr:discoidin domain-containing protein [Planctomycetota bacterium]
MPQWIQVDLGEGKTIDHVFVLFLSWLHESLKTRLRIYKYIIEASMRGET